jgi:hypothetical protein
LSAVATSISDTVSVAERNLLTLLRTPQALVFATVQPMIFVLLFRYAFGGAIHVPGVDYVDYLMPGVFAQSVAFGAIGTAVGLSTDLRSGILIRFRTLPMARPGPSRLSGYWSAIRRPRRPRACPSSSCSSSPRPPSFRPVPCRAGCRSSAPTSLSTPSSPPNGP